MKAVEIAAIQVGSLMIDERLIELVEKIKQRAGYIDDYEGDQDEEHEAENSMRCIMYLFRRLNLADSGVDHNGHIGWVFTDEGRDELQRSNLLS